MRKAIIVAKFKESVAWVQSLSPAWDLIVYSKDPDEAEKDGCFLRLANIGRESHTYLTFIIENYHQLPDLCVFTQGSPLEHAPDFMERIGALKIPCGYQALSKTMALFDCFGLPHLAASPFGLDRCSFRDFFERVFGHQPPLLMYVAMNGIFAVDREAIHKRPHSFYKSCLELLVGKGEADFKNRIGVNLVEGHFFERLWPFVFSDFPHVEWSSGSVYGMPEDKLATVAALLGKWPDELKRIGPIKASAILMAADELLRSN